MPTPRMARFGTALLLAGAIACSGDEPTAPMTPVDRSADGTAANEVVARSPIVDAMNARLDASGSNLRVAQIDLIWDARHYDAASPTVLIANNRTHKLNYLWVSGDSRRDGRVGVTYAVSPHLTTTGFGFNLPVAPTFVSWSQAQLDARIEESMSAWRSESCSDAPIERVAVPAGVNPDVYDELVLGGSLATYQQVSDIVQGGWEVPAFFDAFGPGGGDGIIGIAITFIFEDDEDNPTDIDGDGRFDTALVELYYNAGFFWNDAGTGAVSFYSIITHETGHALGLAHFGKVFVTKKDAADGLTVSDVKYAPKALMNAVYVTGRDEIAGTDRASFCQIWADAN